MERATSSCAGFICNPMARDERLEPAVKPVGLKRDRHDQAGAPRGLSALPPLRSPGESGPGSSRVGGIRDVCLMGLDHRPNNTSLFQLSLAGY